MSIHIGIRDNDASATDAERNGGLYSPAKEKAANRGVYSSRSPLLLRRVRQLLAAAKVKTLLGLCFLCFFVLATSRLRSFMGWNPHYPSSVSSPSRYFFVFVFLVYFHFKNHICHLSFPGCDLFVHLVLGFVEIFQVGIFNRDIIGAVSFYVVSFRGGYTILINTWKRNSLLKQSVAHYASCRGTDAIHVVWSEIDPPSETLKAYLKKIVFSKSQTFHKPNFKFDINEEDDLNNRFKPIEQLRTDAIFSVDDDVVVPCSTLDFAFTVWQSAPFSMVGFVPRMHWLDKSVSNIVLLLACLLF
jgi:hypothetical protein